MVNEPLSTALISQEFVHEAQNMLVLVSLCRETQLKRMAVVFLSCSCRSYVRVQVLYRRQSDKLNAAKETSSSDPDLEESSNTALARSNSLGVVYS